MSRKLAAAIAAGALGAGLLLGAVGVALAGDRTPGGMMGTGGAGQVCDASHMQSLMGGSMDELMDDMMGTGLHQQHHATQP